MLVRSIFLLLLLATKLGAVIPPYTSLSLAWERAPTHGPDITYVLRWGTSVGATTWSTNVGNQTSVTVTNPTSGTLYFSVVARSSDGLLSDPSNTVVATNYPAAPLQLRISTNTSTSLKLEGTEDGKTWIYLATVTNDPAQVAMRRNMIFRASTNLPPLPK
jgi:hypothetical protein